MKTKTGSSKLFRSIILLFTITTFFFACKKFDSPSTSFTEKFFSINSSVPNVVTRSMNELKRQNVITGFIEDFAKDEGFAYWDKSIIRSLGNNSAINRENIEGQGADTIVIIPLIKEGENIVNGFLLFRINDSIQAHLYRANDYDKFPYGDLNSGTLNAEKVAAMILELDASIFGERKFELTDTSIFKINVSTPVTTISRRTVEYSKAAYSIVTICTLTALHCPYALGSCFGLNGACDKCENTCADWECYDVVIAGGSGGDGNWPPDDPPIGPTNPGGGSPSGSGNCTGNNDCNATRTQIIDGRVPCGGCGVGPIIILPIDPPSPNQSIIDSLAGYPCAQSILAQLPNINNEVQSMFSVFLNSSNLVDIKFRVNPALSGTLTNGQTLGPAQMINGIFTVTVELNPWVLTNSTREYIFSTFLHESLHAFMDYQWRQFQISQDTAAFAAAYPIFWNYRRMIGSSGTEFAQHEQMTSEYLNFLSDALLSFNPNISYQTRKRLAWEGLKETTLWFNNLDDTTAANRTNAVARDTSLIAGPLHENYSMLNLTRCP